MATPKQTDPQFKLRFTPELRDQIEASAKANNRSMNAEIVARLEESFTFAQKEARHRVEIAETNEYAESLHQKIFDFQRQLEIKDEARIDSLAEIKRLRTSRQDLYDKIEERQSEIEALRSELGDVRQILRNYATHSEHLHAIEEQLRFLGERLSANATANILKAKKNEK